MHTYPTPTLNLDTEVRLHVLLYSAIAEFAKHRPAFNDWNPALAVVGDTSFLHRVDFDKNTRLQFRVSLTETNPQMLTCHVAVSATTSQTPDRVGDFVFFPVEISAWSTFYYGPESETPEDFTTKLTTSIVTLVHRIKCNSNLDDLHRIVLLG